MTRGHRFTLFVTTMLITTLVCAVVKIRRQRHEIAALKTQLAVLAARDR